MKQIILQLAEKIDGLDLHRRRLIFLAVVLMAAMLASVLFLGPLLSAQKKLSGDISRNGKLLSDIHVQIEALATSAWSDPDAENKKRLAELRHKLAQTNASLLELQQKMVTPDKMANLLEDVLRKNGRLQLIAMQSLPASGLLDEPEGTPGGGAAQMVSNGKKILQLIAKQSLPAIGLLDEPEGTLGSGAVQMASSGKKIAPARGQDERREKILYKQGMRITLRGSYADLLQYLTMLESLPWQMYWGNASFKVEQYPSATLTFTVYTLSMDRAWLSI